MKILQINSVYKFGSTGRITYELNETINDTENKGLVCYGRNFKCDDEKSFYFASKADNYIHGIYTRFFDKHGFASFKNTKFLVKKIQEFNPDIIHIHNLHGYYLNIEILFEFLSKYNKPIIWTLHDCWAITGHCTNFNSVKCFKWKKGCYKCTQLKEYPKSLGIDNSRNNYKIKKRLFTKINDMTICVPSNWLASVVEQSFLNKYEIKVIKNGIDLKQFQQKTLNIFEENVELKGKKILLGVSNVWNDKKGITDFLKLADLIDDSYKIVLVGLNSKQIKALPQKIVGIERVQNVQKLAEIYSSACVFVNLSKEETFGLVSAEAMACGTPVVAYNTTANPEIISEDCGRLVKIGDIEGIYQAVKAVLNGDQEKYAYNCIERVKRYFDKESTYQKYLKIYESKANKLENGGNRI